MGTVLEFALPENSQPRPRRSSVDAGEPRIVIFPGIRIERVRDAARAPDESPAFAMPGEEGPLKRR